MLKAALMDGNGGPGRSVSWAEAKGLVVGGCEGTLWVDAVAPSAEELAELAVTFGLHALTMEDLQHRNQRAKVEEFSSYLFVVMHWYAPECLHVDDPPYELHCILGPHFLLTVSDPKPLTPVETAWTRFMAGGSQRGPAGAEAALYRVLDELVDAHAPRLDTLEDEIEELAERVRALEETPSIIKDLSELRRRVIRFRRVITAERDVVQALARRDYQLLSQSSGVFFRDVADHLTRTYEGLDALREHTDLLTQEHFAFTENERSRVIKRLTVVSTIFLPLNFITGFFGMNFTHLPFESWTMLGVGLSSMIIVPSTFMVLLLVKKWL
jgi:magnesium transporter